MAIKDVESKCWILALFVRDDGERFLLGDGSYEFTEKQLHFAANTMANDVVEVQGNDGYLLAGQVRRPSTQTFDGYVGDSSTSKALVEERRRAFFAFFRKNFFYKVIYIFPDGSAIQRKRGFLVDAPEVKEIRQIYPEYHVALNFEDINYYYYDEDADGQEIYGKSATINLNSVAQSGGLIWLLPSEMTLTGEGTSFTLSGTVNGTALTSADLKGDTTQQTYSGKNLFDKVLATASSSDYSLNANGDITTTADNYSTGRRWMSLGTFAAGVYTLSFLPFLVGATNRNMRVSVRITSTNDTIYDETLYGIVDGVLKSASFTLSTSAAIGICLIPSAAPPSGANIYFSDVQIEEGSTATAYEPYVGGIASPNPDYPQEVQVVTGEQTVTITDGQGQSQEYEVNLGDIELCKIGDYQDRIYRDGGDWYLHKAVRHLSLAINDMNNADAYPGWRNQTQLKSDLGTTSGGQIYTDTSMITNIAGLVTSSSRSVTKNFNGNNSLLLLPTDYYGSSFTQTYWKTNYSNLVVDFYYGINGTITDTQITNTDLIAQLEALLAATTYNGSTSFTVDGNGNLAAILAVEVEAVGGGGVEWDENGAVWEEGKPSYSIISVDSIDNVYPVLTITGRTVNPVLTDVTTGTIFRYNGTITESQVLRVDMMNKTATLNGVSVIGNVTGDWLYLAPGNNRVTYTADNADAPNATVEWQEIVG